MILAALAALAHVPTYTSDDACVDNCCVPGSLNLNTSQVLYLKGSGGLEIPLANADAALHPDRAAPIPKHDQPFRVYFDVVLRNPISDFSMIEISAAWNAQSVQGCSPVYSCLAGGRHPMTFTPSMCRAAITCVV